MERLNLPYIGALESLDVGGRRERLPLTTMAELSLMARAPGEQVVLSRVTLGVRWQLGAMLPMEIRATCPEKPKGSCATPESLLEHLARYD